MRALLNLSVNETLSRTIMTSGTTLVAVLALYFFGGEVLRGFSFALIWGILVGTYSSIYVAAPFLLYLNLRKTRTKGGGDADVPEPGKAAAAKTSPAKAG